MRRDEKFIYENEKGQQIEFSIWSPFFLERIHGIDGLDNIIYTNKSVNQDGSTYVSDSLNSRNIIIEGSISTDNISNREKILNIMNPKLEGKLTYKSKYMEKYINCRIEQAPKLDKKEKFPAFLISILCPDPFWKDIEEESKDLVTWIPNLEFPFSTEQTPNYWIETGEPFEEFQSGFGTGEGIEFGYRLLNQIVEIDNIGDVETPLRVIFRASADVVKPYIQDMNSYELIRVNKTLKARDKLEIITEYGNKNIYLNGEKAHQYLDFLNSTWLQLRPGVNLIKYGAESGINTLECRVFYTPKYLGV